MKIIYITSLFFFLIISLFVFSLSYAQDSENSSEYSSAILEGSTEDLKNALNQTRQFLVDNPYHLEERANECAYLLELKLLNETQTCLEKAASDFPNDLVIQENLGGFYFLNKEYDAAKTQLAIVHNLDSEDTVHYSNYLSARVMVGDDPDEIIPEIKALIEKDPSITNLFLTIAKLLNDKNQPSEARQFLEQISVTNNTSIKYFTQMGISYAWEKNFENAEKYLLMGFEKDPNDIGVLKNLGKMYSDWGDDTGNIEYYKKSIEMYDSILKIEPEHKEAQIGLDYAYGRLFELLNWRVAVVSSIIFGTLFAYFVYNYFRYHFQLRHEERNFDNSDDKTLDRIIINKVIFVFASGISSIPLFLVLISFTQKIQIITYPDISNWASMTAEIIIGITVAAMIFTYESSRNSKFKAQQTKIEKIVKDVNQEQSNISKIVKDIKNIESKQNKIFEGQLMEKQQRTRKAMERITISFLSLEIKMKKFDEKLNEFFEGKISKEEIIKVEKQLHDASESMESTLALHVQDLESDLITQIQHTYQFIGILDLSYKNEEIDKLIFQTAQEYVNNCKKGIEKYDANLIKQIEKIRKDTLAEMQKDVDALKKQNNNSEL